MLYVFICQMNAQSPAVLSPPAQVTGQEADRVVYSGKD